MWLDGISIKTISLHVSGRITTIRKPFVTIFLQTIPMLLFSMAGEVLGVPVSLETHIAFYDSFSRRILCIGCLHSLRAGSKGLPAGSEALPASFEALPIGFGDPSS